MGPGNEEITSPTVGARLAQADKIYQAFATQTAPVSGTVCLMMSVNKIKKHSCSFILIDSSDSSRYCELASLLRVIRFVAFRQSLNCCLELLDV